MVELMASLAQKRGIKQGDPISPFLFMIMVEALDRGITNLRKENGMELR